MSLLLLFSVDLRRADRGGHRRRLDRRRRHPAAGALGARLCRYQADQWLSAAAFDAEDHVARYRWTAGSLDGEACLGSAYRAGFDLQAVEGVAARRLGAELVAVGAHDLAAAAFDVGRRHPLDVGRQQPGERARVLARSEE